MAVNLETVKAQKTPIPPTGRKQTKAELKARTAQALKDLDITPKWDTLPELKQYRYKPENGKAMGFGDLCEKVQQLQSEINFRELQKKELQKEMELAMAMAGTSKVEWEDRPVSIITSHGASSIDGHLLLEHGVAPTVIVECTIPGKEYTYPLIGKVPKSKQGK